MFKKETIILFSAHTDDYALGAGGTVKKYAKEGKKVIAVIFSYGESSHPWLKHDIVQKMRSKEALEAGKLLGCETIFLNLKEFHFYGSYKNKNPQKELIKLINKEKPAKIFTHSSEDPHPDHRGVYKITMDLYKKIKPKPELYVFSIWNPVSFKTSYPALYVDVSKTFSLKLKALKTFRSQKVHIAYPLFLLLFRAIREGFKIRKKFAEKFLRIK